MHAQCRLVLHSRARYRWHTLVPDYAHDLSPKGILRHWCQVTMNKPFRVTTMQCSDTWPKCWICNLTWSVGLQAMGSMRDASSRTKAIFTDAWAWREQLQRAMDGCHTTDDMSARSLAQYEEFEGPNIPLPSGYQVCSLASAVCQQPMCCLPFGPA